MVIELGLPHANILVLGDFEGSAPKPTSPRDHIPPGDVVRSRFAGMPELTRRRYNERPDCWRIYYGDVRVGTVARRTGNPHDTHPWLWSCGFYPGSHLGEFQNGTASTFDDARADFESAWHAFYRNAARPISKRGAISAIGLKRSMPCTKLESACHLRSRITMRCPCGEVFDSHKLELTLIHVPHITKAHKANEIRGQQTAQ